MKPLLLILTASLALAQERPRITGVSHYAIYSSDIEKTRAFYKDYLGYAEPYDLKNPDGSLSLTFIKINDRQFVEVFPKEAGTDRLNHVSLETDDIEQMRLYLQAKGVKVPEKVGKVRIGNLAFNVKDPDGHTVEFVQYVPGSLSSKDKGKNLPATRISDYMAHYGILSGKLDASLAFYKDILGFTETWRGGAREDALSWVNIKVPDGDDYIELMLYRELPEPTKRGSQHHICLFVPEIEKAKAELLKRPGYSRPLEVRTGINRRRQLNLFDHDGTRVEFMEPRTVDGVPPAWSKAPAPR
jgi:catechol 2,3-dioxygenase-like lactoylglutathione lyase family enzyme